MDQNKTHARRRQQVTLVQDDDAHAPLMSSLGSKHTPVGIYLGNDTLLTRTKLGFKVLLPSEDFDIVPHLVLDGEWEPGVTLALQKLVQPGWSVVEGGANVGYFSLLLGSLVGPQGRVVTYEPNPRLVPLLKKNLYLNNIESVEVHEAALGEAAGEVILNLFEGGYGSSNTLRDHRMVERFHPRKVACRSARLSDVKGPVDLIKLDIEGAELDALRGGIELLRQSSRLHLLVEFCPGLLDLNTPNGTRELVALLNGVGLRKKKIVDRTSGELWETTDEHLAATAMAELLCCRE